MRGKPKTSLMESPIAIDHNDIRPVFRVRFFYLGEQTKEGFEFSEGEITRYIRFSHLNSGIISLVDSLDFPLWKSLDDDEGGHSTVAVAVEEGDVDSGNEMWFGFECVIGQDKARFESELFCRPFFQNSSLLLSERGRL